MNNESTDIDFIKLVYNTFTTENNLIIDIPTTKSIQTYFLENQINGVEEILKKIANEYIEKHTDSQQVEFEEFKEIIDQFLSKSAQKPRDGLIYRSGDINVYEPENKNECLLKIISNKSNENEKEEEKIYKLVEIRNMMRNPKYLEFEDVCPVIVEIRVDAFGGRKIFDLSDEISICSENFCGDLLNEISVRCSTECVYRMELKFKSGEKNNRISGKIFPFSISGTEINEKKQIESKEITDKYITINHNSRSKLNITTKKSVPGQCELFSAGKSAIVLEKELVICVTNLGSIVDSVDLGIGKASRENRLKYFIENVCLKYFVPLVSENRNKIGGNKIFWIVLNEDIECKFDFNFEMKDIFFEVDAQFLKSSYEYELKCNEGVNVVKGTIVGYFN